MKKILILLASASLVFFSCNKEESVKAVPSPVAPCEVTVSVTGTATKATGVTYDNESKVNSLQVFVFDGDKLEAYRSGEGVTSLVVPVSAGTRRVVALVNAPDLSDRKTPSALLDGYSLLSDNAIDGLVMVGEVTQELSDGVSVPVTVSRLVSRISLGKVSTAFAAGTYREKYSVVLHGVYLINVRSLCSYSGTMLLDSYPVVWHNCLAHNSEALDYLLYDDIEDVEIKNGTSYEGGHVFYAYRNDYPVEGEEPDYSAVWSPRGTMLVLEVTMYDGDGEAVELTESGQTTGYYPVALPALLPNRTYSVREISLTRLPGAVPYQPIVTGEAGVTIVINDWVSGTELDTIVF